MNTRTVHRSVASAVAVAMCAITIGCDRVERAPLSPSPPGTPTQRTAGDAMRPLVGGHALTLTLGASCAVVPEQERTRTYAATIAFSPRAGMDVVTLESGTFLYGDACAGGSGVHAGMGCHQFFIGDDIDAAWATLEADVGFHGGTIVERLGSGGWLVITGHAYGPYDRRQIDLTGTARVSYCPAGDDGPFGCRPLTCESSLQLAFRGR